MRIKLIKGFRKVTRCDKICGNLVSWIFSTSFLLGLRVLYGQGLDLDKIQALLVIVDILLRVGILV